MKKLMVVCTCLPLCVFVACTTSVGHAPLPGLDGPIGLSTNTVGSVDSVPAVSNRVDSAYDEIELLTEVMLHVKKQHVNEKTYKEIVHGALNGMLQSLDPHSSFLEPQSYERLKDDTSGEYGGIGIYLELKDTGLSVVAPIEDTPGYRAGLQSDDRILEIDGEKTKEMKLDEAVRRMRGEPGTKVVLTIGRSGTDAPERVELVREVIAVPSIKGVRLLREGIGYLRVTQFQEPTVDLFEKAIQTLVTSNSGSLKGLVIDLRGNPGGLLKSAIGMAERLLPRGHLIVTTRGREGVSSPIENVSMGNVHHTDFPVAVLVNGGSASASEIVAAALRDNGRAVLVGGTTYGKGSVQSVIPIRSEPGAGIRLTTALYYTPSGAQINDKGVEPDIPVYVLPEEWRKVQTRRAHLENPLQFKDKPDEVAKVADVVDRALERALDVLIAFNVFQGPGAR